MRRAGGHVVLQKAIRQSMSGRDAGRARLASAILPALLLFASAALIGCDTYRLRGKVVEGGTSGVFVVEQDDPRLERPGLGGAVVKLTLEPGRLSAKHLSPDSSDLEGDFAIAVHEFGAGVLEYPVRLTAQMRGHRSASQRFMLPGSKKRVLVVLAPGEDKHPPKQNDLLGETLEMGEPYMDNPPER